jgi:hypothetical protein
MVTSDTEAPKGNDSHAFLMQQSSAFRYGLRLFVILHTEAITGIGNRALAVIR